MTPTEMQGASVVEAARDHAETEQLWAELGNEPDRLFEVDCALQRLYDGTYGFCELTGNVIPAERLRAMPWTRYALAASKPVEHCLTDAKMHSD